MINHRGPEFAALIRRATARLKEFFQTQNDVLILTASGSGAMEAAVVNTLSPGQRVLAVSVGAFGDRFAQIAQAFGAQVVKLDFPWGQAADPAAVAEALSQGPGFAAVLLTHNETSTGVTNDLEALSRVVHEAGGDALLIVDAISSLGAIDLPVDRWGCDVVIAGSQKGWMVPPGLAMVSVGPRAWQAAAQAKMPRFYWDFAAAKRYLERGQTPATPAVSLFFALDKALELMAEEGLENIIARHRRIGEYTRAGLKALGFTLFAQGSHASNTVTAVRVPEGMDGAKLRRALREEYGVVVAGGQGLFTDKIFRIGHLGFVSEADIDGVLEALGRFWRA